MVYCLLLAIANNMKDLILEIEQITLVKKPADFGAYKCASAFVYYP